MKQHKNKVIAGVIIVAALAVSFFLGGGLGTGSGTGDPGQQPTNSQVTQSGTDPSGTGDTGQKPGEATASGDRPEQTATRPPTIDATASSGPENPGQTPVAPEQETPTQNTQPPQTPVTPPEAQPTNSQQQGPEQPPESSASQPQATDNQPGASTSPGNNTDKELTATLTISCATILNNMDKLAAGKEGLIPPGGIIFSGEVVFYEGESVFNVLLREVRKNKIHMEFVNTPIYNSAYIEGINNIYEFDAGERSGWMYSVNGQFPNYGSSRYTLQDGDKIMWLFTCDRGADIGGGDASDSYNFG